MDPIPTSKSVIPNPRTPRTIGILNIIFGSGLLLCGLGCGAYFTFALPNINKAMETAQKKMEEKDEQDKKATLEMLNEQAKEAKTEEERLEIKAKQIEIEKRPKAVIPGAA